MYLFVLLLAMGILVHDQVLGNPVGGGALISDPRLLLAVIFLPRLLLVAVYAWLCRRTAARLGTAHAPAALRLLDRATAALRAAALLLYALDLYLGVLRWVRLHTWNLLLLDDVLFLTPTLLVIAAGWWFYYPIDRRLRDAALLARLDAGLPIHPVWTRRQYLVAQFRHQVAMLLVPLLLIMAWEELVRRHVPARPVFLGLGLDTFLAGGGAMAMLLLAPLLIRRIWDTARLPDGPLRDRLTGLCRQYHVRVRELLLWRTYGGMINGAVLGFIAPVRYVLLTDALLELMPAREVEAVMAHELAHIRKHHLLWLALASLAVLGLCGTAVGVLVRLAASIPGADRLPARFWQILGNGDNQALAMLVLGLALCAPVFCWISRRFERQADTFAVQHLTRARAVASSTTGAEGTLLIDPDSVAVMAQALQSVADLNRIPVARRSWRHGSIAWRQDYLRELPGRPIDRLAIDRVVLRIKIATAIAVAASLAFWFCWQ